MNTKEAPTNASGQDRLAELFASRIRASVLSYLVPRLESRFSLTEFSRALVVPISSLQHECYKLERLGILNGKREGSSYRYQWNLGPVTNRILIDLVIGYIGIERCLREAVSDAGSVEIANLVGDPDRSRKLTLILVGNLDLETLDVVQTRAAMLLNRQVEEIQVAFFNPDEWIKRQEAFLRKLQNEPVLSLVETGS